MITTVAGETARIAESAGAYCSSTQWRRRTLYAFRAAFTGGVAGLTVGIVFVITTVAVEIALLIAVT